MLRMLLDLNRGPPSTTTEFEIVLTLRKSLLYHYVTGHVRVAQLIYNKALETLLEPL